MRTECIVEDWVDVGRRGKIGGGLYVVVRKNSGTGHLCLHLAVQLNSNVRTLMMGSARRR